MKGHLRIWIALLFFGSSAWAGSIDWMPIPQSVRLGDGRFRLRTGVGAELTGDCRGRASGALERALQRIVRRTRVMPTIHAHCGQVARLEQGEDESYVLKVDENGVWLDANTDLGIVRGVETLLQALKSDDQGSYVQEMEVRDAPRFAWRGLLIDVSRHFHPVEVIKRNLDAMAALKMNVFHWHLTDDHGFRVESKSLPKLHQMGSDQNYYTQDQVREIIAYADARGIRVMPEFDMPGHSSSWFVGYPELATLPGPHSIPREFGKIFDSAMNPARESTYVLLQTFLSEMAALFPDEYIHIGGDENTGKQWDQSAEVQQFMREKGFKSNHELQAYFTRRVNVILNALGKKTMGWDDILHADVDPSVMMQAWRSVESLQTDAKAGHPVVLSAGYYIDLMLPASEHYLVDPLPPGIPLSDAEKARVLGGEATMWSEWVTPETIDSRVWMRTAAIAEVYWSPYRARDLRDLYRRLEVLSPQLEELGLMHEKAYPTMLTRLAGGIDSGPLKTFMDLVEPVKLYERGTQKKYDSLMPLVGVVDTARPDAKVPREFNWDVLAALVAPKAANWEPLMARLSIWRSNHSLLAPLMDRAPLLTDVKPLSEALMNVSEIGMDAIRLIQSGQKPSAFWSARAAWVISDASKPRAEIELMIVDSVRRLVAEAQGNRESVSSSK